MSLFIINIFLYNHIQFLAILYPTPLANMVVQVGTRHCHQILFFVQEILQNAEDAGARTVKFLFDENSYGKDVSQLYHPGLAEFQVS